MSFDLQRGRVWTSKYFLRLFCGSCSVRPLHFCESGRIVNLEDVDPKMSPRTGYGVLITRTFPTNHNLVTSYTWGLLGAQVNKR